MVGKAGFAVIVGSIASVAAVTVSSAEPVGAQTAPEANVAPVLDWKPCGRDFPGALCATAEVPLDYGDPQGPSTSIALAKIPASNKRGKRGSVFVNPGGPGGSGVEFVLGGFGELLAGNLRGRFDIVGFDPRGVGASDPLRCFKSQRALDRYFANVPLFPYEQPQFRPFFDTYDSLGPKCLAKPSAVAAHMNTADVARDVDLLRAAVGDAQLTYVGFSYGSFLGTTYANLFPDRVRALVIDGVLNPELWSSGQQIRSDRVATQQEFQEFLRLCDEAGPDCAFSERGGSTKQWEALAEAVRRRPIALPDGTIYSYDFLIGDAAGAMYAPEVWPVAAELLDSLEDLALGDQDAADRAVSARIALWAQLTPPGLDANYPNGLDAYFGNQCADTEYPSTFGEFRATGQFAEEGSRFGPYWWWFNNGCSSWPVNQDRYIGPWTAMTSAPVLVVGNYFDGVTDYAGAQAVNGFLGGSRLLSYAGWGHTAYGRSACVTASVDAYLLNGSLPPEGTVCPANPNPFLDASIQTETLTGVLVGLPPTWPTR